LSVVARVAILLSMSGNPDPVVDFRDLAARSVVAAEYFKVAGQLPAWARAELDSWRCSDAAAGERRSQVRAGIA
jgi:hypothetical protein